MPSLNLSLQFLVIYFFLSFLILFFYSLYFSYSEYCSLILITKKSLRDYLLKTEIYTQICKNSFRTVQKIRLVLTAAYEKIM